MRFRLQHARHLALPFAFLSLAGSSLAHEHEEQKLLASDGVAGDQFGRSSAVFGSTVAIGAPNAAGTGAVYVFEHDGEEFHEEAKLVPSDGLAGDLFGLSVALFDETILIGAPGHDGAGTDAGAAYVFVHNGVSWVEEQKLLPLVSAPGDSFGHSVALHEETAAVGAPRNNALAGAVTGSAFVFVRSFGVWTEEQELQAPGAATGNQFGTGVAVEDDTLVVGALLASGRVARTGAAFVFDRAFGVWTASDKLIDSSGNKNDFFGIAVSMHDGVIAVGASGDDDAGNGSGSVFGFANGSGGWFELHQYEGKGAGDLLGASVSRAYRATLAGSRFDDDGANNAGSSQIFVGFGTSVEYQIYIASDAVASNFLGTSVAVSDCFIVSGAPGEDALGNNAGAAYIYILREPEATVFNGSNVNPLCMTTTELPVIGSHWMVEVDTSPFPTAASSTVIVYNSLNGLPPMRPFGEILINRASGFIMSSLIVGTGVVEHEFDIPDDPYFVGVQYAAQAVIRSGDPGIPIIGLCNAESVTIGCMAEGGHHEEE